MTRIVTLAIVGGMLCSAAQVAVGDVEASATFPKMWMDRASCKDAESVITLDAASDAVKVAYSARAWDASAAMGSCSLYDNGTLVASFDGEGEFSWSPSSYGAHVLSLAIDCSETLQRGFFKDYPADFVVASSSSPISMDTRADEEVLVANGTERIARAAVRPRCCSRVLM